MINNLIYSTPDPVNALKKAINNSEVILIGAGAGLSTSAGFTYSGDRFHKYFQDFIDKYGIKDMYSGGFYPFPDKNTFWGWWSRQIWINRYMNETKHVYENLYKLVNGKTYFVITTNVDHCFQKAGFDKERLFYTQGDYGLLQCSEPCHKSTYDNKETVKKMLEYQGFKIAPDNDIMITDKSELKSYISNELIPKCPKCGKPMSMNLRSDNTFVEDKTWHIHYEMYNHFLENNLTRKVLFLELGIGGNTPGIIKIPFLQMTSERNNATYACINKGEAFAPENIKGRVILINDDIGNVLKKLI